MSRCPRGGQAWGEAGAADEAGGPYGERGWRHERGDSCDEGEVMTGPLPVQCQRCSGHRIARIYGHCSDMCSVDLAGRRYHGYVPRDLGVGGGDAVNFDYCMACGQIQGKFPLPPAELERPSRSDS